MFLNLPFFFLLRLMEGNKMEWEPGTFVLFFALIWLCAVLIFAVWHRRTVKAVGLWKTVLCMVNKIHYLYTRICLIIFKYNCLSTSVGVLNQKKKKVELLKTLHFPKLTSFEGGLLLSLNFSLLCEELKSEDDCIKLDNLVNCRVLHLH